MKRFSIVFLFLACCPTVYSQVVQKNYCTNTSSCSLPNPVSSGNMIVAIGGLPDATDSQGDTFFEITATGWYATASNLWYATGVHGGPVTVTSPSAVPYFYLAEYPPATLDTVAPQVFNCCATSAAIGLTTTLPSELLIEWTSYATSVTVQDADVAPGPHSFTIPNTGPPVGLALASFRLLGPEFTKYKAPYAPIQIKGCMSSSCQLDNPVSATDLLVVYTSMMGCPVPLQPNCVTDNLSNQWQIAVPIPYDGSIWYVLNAKPGTTAVSFIPATPVATIVIVEYPPAVGFDGASYGVYGPQNIDAPHSGSDDVGYTLPVQTTKQCDLLVSMGIDMIPPDTGSTWVPGPVPYFTVRGGLDHRIGFEDSTSSIPGLYIASMNFGDYTHWTEGLAAFDMNGCK